MAATGRLQQANLLVVGAVIIRLAATVGNQCSTAMVSILQYGHHYCQSKGNTMKSFKGPVAKGEMIRCKTV